MILRRLLLCAAVLLALAHCWRFSDFTVDDGAISFSYARSLAHGDGLVLVPDGERVEGYTNFLWVLLLAFGIKLGIDPFRFSHLLGGALAGLSVLGAATLMATLRGRRSAWDALPAFFTAALPPIAYWAMSGLEGGLYTALVVWGIARLLIERDAARKPISALLAAGCALTRPDGLAILACAVVVRAIFAATTTGDRSWRRLLAWLALATAPVITHFAWRYSYYAYPLPNTFYAKVREPFRTRELFNLNATGWKYVLGFCERYRLGVLFALGAFALWPRRGFVERAATVAFAIALLFFPIYARGDWMSEGRFIVAVLPLICVLALVGVRQLAAALPTRADPYVCAACIFAMCFFVLPKAWFHSKERRGNYPVPAEHVAKRGRHYHELADRYAMNPRSALDGDLGGTSYYAGMDIVDLGMLADVTLARYKAFPQILREYIHGERRPSFMRLAGFWLEDGVQSYPEFADRYVPSGMPDIFVDRRYFEEDAIDPRTPFFRFDSAGVDLLGARVGDRVDLWLLARHAATTKLMLGSIEARHEILSRERWWQGEIVHLILPRPPGPLRLCAGVECTDLAVGASGAQPIVPPLSTQAALDRAIGQQDLELALTIAQRLSVPTLEIGRRLYARAIAAEAAGDTQRAFRDYALSLRADPGLAFARRHLEALRFAAREPYRYRYESRLQQAIRAFHLDANETTFASVVTLARAANNPRAAEAAYLATKIVPGDPSVARELARLLVLAGEPDSTDPSAQETSGKIVGNTTPQVELDPFTHDFEGGSIEGWTATNSAFQSPVRYQLGSPLRGFEGNFFLYASSIGELRSLPLAANVDEVCFLLAGTPHAGGVRFDIDATVSALPVDDKMMRETCVHPPASASGARIVVFDSNPDPREHVAVDDFACFARGVPMPCAGSARVVP